MGPIVFQMYFGSSQVNGKGKVLWTFLWHQHKEYRKTELKSVLCEKLCEKI